MSKNKINRLWIPEKPSVAKNLVGALEAIGAKVVNRSSAGKDGFTRHSNGDVVCSVFGHMLTMLPPSHYLTKEQNADPINSLPLIPNPFKFEPKPEVTKAQKVMMRNGKPVPSARFVLLEKLIKQAKELVNACDIDREGQLIFDELLEFVGIDPYASNVYRAVLVSNTPEALHKTITELEPNGDPKWRLRSDAAQTRQKLDWLLGMNASMAYQSVTGIRTMSVGRVQTPVLAMVVRRDLEIENFVPQAYYVPVVILSDGTRLRWEKRHGAEGQPGFDPNGRIIDKGLAQAIVNAIMNGQSGEVRVAESKERSSAPPLPFSMGTLQAHVARRHGLTVAQVTKAAQSLYEKHKAITYVGTDCQYLPEDMHGDATDLLAKLSKTTAYKEIATGANPALRSRAFNDKKVDEHFAIIPTSVLPPNDISEAERAVYDAVSRRYMAQFYPNYKALTASLHVIFGQDEFRASAKKDLERGWKIAEGITQDEDDEEDAENQSPAD